MAVELLHQARKFTFAIAGDKQSDRQGGVSKQKLLVGEGALDLGFNFAGMKLGQMEQDRA